MKSTKLKKITSIGSGLIDIIFQSSLNFLYKIKIKNEDMTMINMDRFNSILSKFHKKPIIVPGGSSCNTSIAISKLKKKSQFICKIGKDNIGNFLKNNLIKNEVIPFAPKDKLPTGRVISIITSDAQRTMLTYLGASSKISFKRLPLNFFKDTKILHIEGFLMFNLSLVKNILNNTKKKSYISIDLSSSSVIKKGLKNLRKIICTYIDIVLSNEKEAEDFGGTKKKFFLLKKIPKQTRMAVIKVGEKGSILKYKKKIIFVPPLKTEKNIDTTGAGDTWTAGFFSGLSSNFSIEKSVKIGSLCASNVCAIIGAKLPEQYWNRINESIRKSKRKQKHG